MYSLKDALYKAFRPHGLIHGFQTSNPQQKFKSRQILIGREISAGNLNKILAPRPDLSMLPQK